MFYETRKQLFEESFQSKRFSDNEIEKGKEICEANMMKTKLEEIKNSNNIIGNIHNTLTNYGLSLEDTANIMCKHISSLTPKEENKGKGL